MLQQTIFNRETIHPPTKLRILQLLTLRSTANETQNTTNEVSVEVIHELTFKFWANLRILNRNDSVSNNSETVLISVANLTNLVLTTQKEA